MENIIDKTDNWLKENCKNLKARAVEELKQIVLDEYNTMSWKDAHKNPPDTNRVVFVAIKVGSKFMYDKDYHNTESEEWVYFPKRVILWMDIPKKDKKLRVK